VLFTASHVARLREGGSGVHRSLRVSRVSKVGAVFRQFHETDGRPLNSGSISARWTRPRARTNPRHANHQIRLESKQKPESVHLVSCSPHLCLSPSFDQWTGRRETPSCAHLTRVLSSCRTGDPCSTLKPCFHHRSLRRPACYLYRPTSSHTPRWFRDCVSQ
jgi:hypothetical protein